MIDLAQFKNINIFGEKLFDLCEQTSHLCAIQDHNSNYITVNQSFSNLLGLRKKEMIGNDLRDLALSKLELNSKLNEIHIQKAEAVDQQIYITKKTIINKRAVFTDHNGLIHVERLVKIPLLNSRKKVIAIFNYSNNFIDYYDPMSLLHLYLDQYKEQDAIQAFLRHLKIRNCFHRLPSYSQLVAILQLNSKNILLKDSPLLRQLPTECIIRVYNLFSQLAVNSIEEAIHAVRFNNPNDERPY